ncbi:hypothetical protein HDU97_007860 [Phlyctochytrium planicorne]|nr:hypothetical protein HDU97_007860 [Phlyctochytrium planicorne]
MDPNGARPPLDPNIPGPLMPKMVSSKPFLSRIPTPPAKSMSPSMSSMPGRKEYAKLQQLYPDDIVREVWENIGVPAVIPKPPSPKNNYGTKMPNHHQSLHSQNQKEKLQQKQKQHLQSQQPQLQSLLPLPTYQKQTSYPDDIVREAWKTLDFPGAVSSMNTAHMYGHDNGTQPTKAKSPSLLPVPSQRSTLKREETSPPGKTRTSPYARPTALRTPSPSTASNSSVLSSPSLENAETLHLRRQVQQLQAMLANSAAAQKQLVLENQRLSQQIHLQKAEMEALKVEKQSLGQQVVSWTTRAADEFKANADLGVEVQKLRQEVLAERKATTVAQAALRKERDTSMTMEEELCGLKDLVKEQADKLACIKEQLGGYDSERLIACYNATRLVAIEEQLEQTVLEVSALRAENTKVSIKRWTAEHLADDRQAAIQTLQARVGQLEEQVAALRALVPPTALSGRKHGRDEDDDEVDGGGQRWTKKLKGSDDG